MPPTGETIDASTAKDFGLVNRIVPKQYLQQVTKYASVIASKSPMALQVGKEASIARSKCRSRSHGYAAEVMVDSMTLESCEEGIGAFLENRMPDWTRD